MGYTFEGDGPIISTKCALPFLPFSYKLVHLVSLLPRQLPRPINTTAPSARGCYDACLRNEERKISKEEKKCDATERGGRGNIISERMSAAVAAQCYFHYVQLYMHEAQWLSHSFPPYGLARWQLANA